MSGAPDGFQWNAFQPNAFQEITPEDEQGGEGEQPQPVTEGGAGWRRLWDVYQQEMLARLVQPKETKRAKRRRKARQRPVEANDALLEALPAERPLEALVGDLRAEQQRLDVVVTTLAETQARIAEADERERVRRKRNNEAALLLLAA